MKPRVILATIPLWILTAVAVILLFIQAATASAQETEGEGLWTVSISHLKLAPGERVIGFDVQLKAARVASLPKVPPAWSITIDNEPSWNSRISGTIGVGAAALGSGNFFEDFLVIEKCPKGLGVEKPPSFGITVEVITTTDFNNEKRIFLKNEDLLLQKQ